MAVLVVLIATRKIKIISVASADMNIGTDASIPNILSRIT